MSKDDRADIKVEEIPLPPPELWGELDNSGAQGAANDAADARPAGKEAVQADVPGLAEKLDFIGGAHERSIPLQHPFRWQGNTVSSITVRRLRIGEVDTILRQVNSATVSLFDIYAAMTGLPASVLRGLIDEDGDAVTEAAYSFLPRALRTDLE